MTAQARNANALSAAKGLLIAAPTSGSGKTLFTLGLIGALVERGLAIAPAKVGPDYIDGGFHKIASGRETVNLDAWAMSGDRIRQLAQRHSTGADMMLMEGVMGLFDGAANGEGSTADVAAQLGAPVLLVVDASRQSQSIAALVQGFMNFRSDINVAGVILNRVASARHERILRDACQNAGIQVFGALPSVPDLSLPSRHLGLVQASDLDSMAGMMEFAANWVTEHCDLDALEQIAAPLKTADSPNGNTIMHNPIAPLGQSIAVALDAAFSFAYPHMLQDWRAQGASLSMFSPVKNEPMPDGVDAVFLPGGYPELHAETLSNANHFMQSLSAAEKRNVLIYGECGGYMVLGESLTDNAGKTHKMAGLLPLQTRLDQPKRILGYRQLLHDSALPFAQEMRGHEFHYSSASQSDLPALFSATDALGTAIAPMGMVKGRTMGSYAHVIDSEVRA